MPETNVDTAEAALRDGVMIKMVNTPAAPPAMRLPVPGITRVDRKGDEVRLIMHFEKGGPAQLVPRSLANLMLHGGPCGKYKTGMNANGEMTYGSLFVEAGDEPEKPQTVEDLQGDVVQLQNQVRMLMDKIAAATPQTEPDESEDDEAPPSGPVDPSVLENTVMAGSIETTRDGCLICPICREYTTQKPPSDEYPAQKYLDMHVNRVHKE